MRKFWRTLRIFLRLKWEETKFAFLMVLIAAIIFPLMVISVNWTNKVVPEIIRQIIGMSIFGLFVLLIIVALSLSFVSWIRDNWRKAKQLAGGE